MNPVNNRAEIQSSMMTVNILAAAPRAINLGINIGVNTACESSDTARRMCALIGEGITTVAATIPQSWKDKFQVQHVALHTRIIRMFEKNYAISPEETKYFLESSEILLGTFAGMGAGKIVLTIGSRLAKKINLVGAKECKSTGFILVDQKPIVLRTENIWEKTEKVFTSIDVSSLSNRSTVAFVQYIENVSNDGHLLRTIERLKNIALAHGSNKLILEFVADSRSLLRLMAARYKHLGIVDKNHFGNKFGSSVHQIEIPLQHSGTAFVHDQFKKVFSEALIAANEEATREILQPLYKYKWVSDQPRKSNDPGITPFCHEITTGKGWKPLHVAVLHGDVRLTDYLLRHGYWVNKASAWYTGHHPSTVPLQKGVNANNRNKCIALINQAPHQPFLCDLMRHLGQGIYFPEYASPATVKKIEITLISRNISYVKETPANSSRSRISVSINPPPSKQQGSICHTDTNFYTNGHWSGFHRDYHPCSSSGRSTGNVTTTSGGSVTLSSGGSVTWGGFR
jgi:hypothetical protein